MLLLEPIIIIDRVFNFNVLLALFEGHLHLGYTKSIYKLKGSFTLPLLDC
jgi:hypothetical protein